MQGGLCERARLGADELQHATFKCPLPECGETFRLFSSLAMHKKRHGGVAARTCSCCLATFLKGGEFKGSGRAKTSAAQGSSQRLASSNYITVVCKV